MFSFLAVCFPLFTTTLLFLFSLYVFPLSSLFPYFPYFLCFLVSVLFCFFSFFSAILQYFLVPRACWESRLLSFWFLFILFKVFWFFSHSYIDRCTFFSALSLPSLSLFCVEVLMTLSGFILFLFLIFSLFSHPHLLLPD